MHFIIIILGTLTKNHIERPNLTKLRMMSSRLFHKSPLLEKPWPCAWGLPQVGLLFFQRRLLICGLLRATPKILNKREKQQSVFLFFECISMPVKIICFMQGCWDCLQPRLGGDGVHWKRQGDIFAKFAWDACDCYTLPKAWTKTWN